MATGSHLALVGLMGSGKTTVGHILAARLARTLIDTDDLIESATGKTIPELFSSEGEPAFRRYELDSLTRALARSELSVIATGGGVVTTPEARRMLELDATVVWLRASPELLAKRLGDDPSRPLLAGRDPLEAIRDMSVHRTPWYEEVADFIVDADDDDADRVADAVLDVVGLTP